MRTAAVMIVVTLAAMAAAHAADQTIDAKVSGKIEASADAKVSGTVTIKLAPAEHEKAAAQDKIEQLDECGKAWAKGLEKYNKARKEGLKRDWLWLTRFDYRSCMDRCLAGEVVTPPACNVEMEKPAQQKTAAPGG